MRFITVTFFALVASLTIRPAEAQTPYTCGDGTFRAAQTVVEMVAGPPVVSIFDQWGEPLEHVEVLPAVPRNAYVVTVQLFDVRYTAEAFTDAPENLDPSQLTETEPLSICVNRDRMTLMRADGTGFRANIVRVERIKRAKTTH